MTALYIILGIIAFIFILLMCPISFYLDYAENEFKFNVYYLFFKFNVIPSKEKEKTAPKKKKQSGKKGSEEKSESSIRKLVNQKGISGLLELLKILLKTVSDAAVSTKKHLIIYRLDVDVIVAGDDAADTAMKYGYVCSAVYPIISFVDSNIKKCKHSENITADFDGKDIRIHCVIRARIKALFLLKTALNTVLKGFKAIAKGQ